MSLPMNGTWKTVAPMPTGRYAGVCAAFGDMIYYACGATSNPITSQGVSSILEIYDTKNDVWASGRSAPIAVAHSGAAVQDDKIYCIGGTVNTDTNIIQIYDTVSGTWEISPLTLPTARRGVKCCIHDGKLYCMGGKIGSALSNIVEILNLETQTWITGKPLPVKNAWGSCVPYKNYLYYVSGCQSATDGPSNVYRYEIDSDTWELYAEIPCTQWSYGCAYEDNIIYCVGGNNNAEASSKVHAFNMDNGNYIYMPSKTAIGVSTESCIVNGKLYAIGGSVSNSPAYGTTEVYPAEDTPTPPSGDKCCCSEIELRIKTCSCNTEFLKKLGEAIEEDGLKGCGTSGCK